MPISQERADRIARAQPCSHCLEYTWRKVTVRVATPALRQELGEAWHAVLVCGVCGMNQEVGIDEDGDVLYAS